MPYMTWPVDSNGMYESWLQLKFKIQITKEIKKRKKSSSRFVSTTWYYSSFDCFFSSFWLIRFVILTPPHRITCADLRTPLYSALRAVDPFHKFAS